MTGFLEDSVSLGLTFVAAMILIYLATFMGFTNLLLIPLGLLALGLALQIYISKKIQHDESTSHEEMKSTMMYTVLALVGIGVGSFVSVGLFKPPIGAVQMSVTDQMLYGALYAISEERFFRGALTSFVFWRTNNTAMSSLASGVIFGWPYHQAVYGTSPEKLMYVVIAGTVLSFVTLRSKRLSPAMLGHLGNNFWASLPTVAASIVVKLGGFF